MSTHSHQHPEDYSRHQCFDSDAAREMLAEGQREFSAEVRAHFWRCVPCDLTFDGTAICEDVGYETDRNGVLLCPNCGRTFNYDERTKKPKAALAGLDLSGTEENNDE